MNRTEILKGLLDSENENNGIDILDLGPVENFEEIKKEVNHIIETKPASYILENSSYLPYIKPYDVDLKAQIIEMSRKIGKENYTYEQIKGANRIFKLFREQPGWVEDCKDYVKYGNNSTEWKFHFSEEYPYVSNFINSLPNLVRFWINGLLPNSRFQPHYEILTWKWNDSPVMVPRLHLPFMDEPDSVFNLNGKNYHLKEGNLYFVNIAAYHYAANNSTKPRFHFLIDCIMSEQLIKLFEKGVIPMPISEEPIQQVDPKFNKRSEYPVEMRRIENIRILP